MAVRENSLQSRLEQNYTMFFDHSGSNKLAKQNFHKYDATVEKY